MNFLPAIYFLCKKSMGDIRDQWWNVCNVCNEDWEQGTSLGGQLTVCLGVNRHECPAKGKFHPTKQWVFKGHGMSMGGEHPLVWLYVRPVESTIRLWSHYWI